MRAQCESGQAVNKIQVQLCLALFIVSLYVSDISSLNHLHWRLVAFWCPMAEISQYVPVFHPSFAEAAAADVGAPMVCGVQRCEITVEIALE